MMSYPTQPGDVLTAATLNTFPLVRLFEGGLGGNSYSVSNVFSSTFDAYRVICSPMGTDTYSGSPTINLRFRTTFDDTSANYSFSQYGHYGGTAFNGGAGAVTAVELSTISKPMHGHLSFDVFNPNLSAVTTVGGNAAGFQVNVNSYVTRVAIGGTCDTLTNYTGFTLFLGSSDVLTGTIRVYGYNQA